MLSRVVEETKKMKIGDPLDRSTQHGPQNHLAHLNKLVEYCETATKEVIFRIDDFCFNRECTASIYLNNNHILMINYLF